MYASRLYKARVGVSEIEFKDQGSELSSGQLPAARCLPMPGSAGGCPDRKPTEIGIPRENLFLRFHIVLPPLGSANLFLRFRIVLPKP